MPRKRVRSKKRNKGELTEEQVHHLLIGFCAGDDFPFKSEAHRRGLWERHKDFLITKDLEPSETGLDLVDREPGTRPHAWWSYSAPEPRRIIKNAKYWRPLSGEENSWRAYFGIYPVLLPANKDVWRETTFPFWEYETEYEYLKRLGLLLPGEAERLEGDHARLARLYS